MKPELPVSDSLVLGPASLAVFIDETGLEDFSDPNFPIFGFGGCAILGAGYRRTIVRPWKQLKLNHLGGANKPFHANELPRLRSGQIGAINRFMRGAFYRLGVVADDRMIKPDSMDNHRPIALRLHWFVEQIALRHELDAVHIVFEHSKRGMPLVVRDFDWIKRNFVDARGHILPCTVNFMAKDLREPGLELSDLIAHTIGRQQRRWLSTPRAFEKDFRAVFHGFREGVVHFTSLMETLERPPGEPLHWQTEVVEDPLS